MRTSVILAGKCDSHRHSTKSFSGNIVQAKTSYQMLGILSFSDREWALTPSTEIHVLTFVVKKKYNEAFRGVCFWGIDEKIKCRPSSRLRPGI